MERFVRMVAPTGIVDFFFKLGTLLLICGLLNHLRDVISNGRDGAFYWKNFKDAAFTALPMCTFALLLIAHLNKLQTILHRQATRDELTGLHNRRWFMGHCPDVFSPKDVLLLCDIDHFKRINDAYGHHIGDVCLQQFAQHLIAALPDKVSAARIGGEEFGIVLSNRSDTEVQKIAANIVAGVQLTAPDGTRKRVTASVGIGRPDSALPVSEMFGLADRALYMAKEGGRAGFRMLPVTPASGQINLEPNLLGQSAITA